MRELPYICMCKYCVGNGWVRFWICSSCSKFIAICDECESVWLDIPALSQNNQLDAQGSRDICNNGHFATVEEVEEAILGKYILGCSI